MINGGLSFEARDIPATSISLDYIVSRQHRKDEINQKKKWIFFARLQNDKNYHLFGKKDNIILAFPAGNEKIGQNDHQNGK